MAESLRKPDSDQGDLTAERRREIVAEALRQSESCLYTSTALFEWLKWVRRYHRFFVAAPIVLGGVAGLTVLKGAMPDWVIAILAFVAALFPALADGLKIQTSVDEITRLAGEFKALQDRFRRLSRVTAPFVDIVEADKQLSELMDRMDAARSSSITAPDWAFEKAREKIVAGDYSFAVDAVA
ncbi:SLATT domain-containing protein [Bosea thiooxidans]|jgi:hypothetical protein